ncbi:polysaccharide ABC transporter ATP-binding protein [Imperialibacter roseus]|uniref:Polysaccharide ABC transporter ATP-binding protein n=1 Tax=Imperialibacter roseus TaxID=1324217 RepID=A0ABZ0IKN0_9BACT|nr:polysaccharide ABC transporter ATP-binding protein [Imperialibacter roseus]WOK05583.1 polysaccharide ABC transporter ATP-binding protein [Imperialibacter roseus]
MNRAIEVEAVSKRYELGQQKAGSMGESLRNIFKRSGAREDTEFWALKDLSFQVNEGEAVGIIGRNGAGKSTLLKILSRITYPTSGSIKIFGRVSSLLEVGTGFHPELSGRENIYLNGTILGMRRTEVKAKFDEIVEFSGVSKFIDTPIKHYSSGMKVRLAFAVAAHLEPEILIIDEVLAVGDFDFQKKCLGKMQQVAGEGRTVLFVSHNMEAVQKLTSSCAYLVEGRLDYMADTKSVISKYLLQSNNDSNNRYLNTAGFGGMYVREILVVNDNDTVGHRWGSELTIEFDIVVNESIKGACFSFQIVNANNVNVGYYWLYASDYDFGAREGQVKIKCVIPKAKLFEGQYWITTWLSDRSGLKLIENLDRICSFEFSISNIVHDEYPWAQGNATYLDDANWLVGESSPIEIKMPKVRQ